MSALAEIARLEKLLDRLAAGGDGAVDGTVGRRLQALADKWPTSAGNGAATEPAVGGDDEDDELESATADDLFRLIDGEFGGTS